MRRAVRMFPLWALKTLAWAPGTWLFFWSAEVECGLGVNKGLGFLARMSHVDHDVHVDFVLEDCSQLFGDLVYSEQ